MEITFEKIGNKYVAEFEVTADFNLHIERAEQGTLEVYQRGIAEGEYDFAWSAGIGARKVIDYDFAALVYPKYIKVVSGSEVLSASVNFNEGGGSGSGSGEASTVEYLDVSELTSSVIAALKGFGLELRVINDEGVTVLGTFGSYLFQCREVAVSIDFNKEIIYNSRKVTVLDALIESSGGGVDKNYFDSIPRITKEQFYNLET